METESFLIEALIRESEGIVSLRYKPSRRTFGEEKPKTISTISVVMVIKATYLSQLRFKNSKKIINFADKSAKQQKCALQTRVCVIKRRVKVVKFCRSIK